MAHKLQLQTQGTTAEQAVVVPALHTNESLFIRRQQLKREIQAIESQLKALDEDIREAMTDGETFGDGATELYLLPVERATFDWKAAVVAGVLTKEQAEPYLARNLSSQIRSRKVEKSSVAPPEGTPEADAMRARIENASKVLVD